MDITDRFVGQVAATWPYNPGGLLPDDQIPHKRCGSHKQSLNEWVKQVAERRAPSSADVMLSTFASATSSHIATRAVFSTALAMEAAWCVSLVSGWECRRRRSPGPNIRDKC